MPDSIDDIIQLATQFRQAMETLRDAPEQYPHLHYTGSNLETFPTLWCDYTSEMLNAYFKSHGYHQFNIVTAFKLRGSRKCHVWLTNEDLVVDITADQFGKRKYPKVLVCQPEDYPLRTEFKKITSKVDMTHVEYDPVQQKHAIYQAVLNLINQSKQKNH